MYKQAAFTFLLTATPLCFAAEATIVGQGETKSLPDYVELTITIESKCYPTPDAAKKVNDTSARKIVDFLNTKIKKKDAYNNVIASGGYTSAYQNFYQDKYYCLNTFQKQSSVTFRTQDLENFESLFNEIQTVALKEFARSSGSFIQQPITFVSMSDASPGLSTELRGKLEQQAMNKAFTDAKAKLDALFGQQLHQVKVTHVSEIAPNEPRPMFENASAPMMMSARMGKGMDQAAAPVQFDEQRFNKTLYFKFVFDDISLPSP
jgi:uncharacterized protein YggE